MIETDPAIRLIIGLGNVGEKYSGTRHNIGFDILNAIFLESRAQMLPPGDLYFLAKDESRDIYLLWPRTFMNRSGLAVQHILTELDLKLNEMLVIVDDFHLELGRLKIIPSGTSGGHNGLESIINALNSDSFPRMRAGIGPLPEGDSIVDFVLQRFSDRERNQAQKMVDRAASAAIFATRNRLDETMGKFNSNPARLD